MTQQLHVIQGQARHNDVLFDWEVSLIVAPEGWSILRGSLKCPKDHRGWFYESGLLARVVRNYMGGKVAQLETA